MGKTLSKPVCVVAGISYPAYASFKALESPSPQDDKQWLTYWAVYGIFTSMETIASRVFSWLPGYYVTKMLVLIWMMLPRTKGALIMYNSVIRPLLIKYEPLIDKKIDDAHAAADDCIQDIQANGSEAIARRATAAKNSEIVQTVTKALADAAVSAAVAAAASSAQAQAQVVDAQAASIPCISSPDAQDQKIQAATIVTETVEYAE